MANLPHIKLCYFGGSGGFILLHLLLLSDEYVCDFDTDCTIEDIIKEQWSIDDPRLWKSKEQWPNNHKTKMLSTDLRKIYFFCHSSTDEIVQCEGSTVFLYTDIESQMQLARYKHAFSFMNASTSLHKNYVSYYRNKLEPWTKHYKNIKDPTWPRCTGPKGFKNLPESIKAELLSNPYTLSHLDFQRFVPLNRQEMDQKMFTILSSRFKFLSDGTKVLDQVSDFFPFADVALKLQDIINDLDLLSVLTNKPVNDKQKKLRTRWLSLHPPELLRAIGIQPL